MSVKLNNMHFECTITWKTL